MLSKRISGKISEKNGGVEGLVGAKQPKRSGVIFKEKGEGQQQSLVSARSEVWKGKEMALVRWQWS